jgi:CDP-paratose 2-epimerase
MDSAIAEETWNWQPLRSLHDILEEIAEHAEQHPTWLQTSAPL